MATSREQRLHGFQTEIDASKAEARKILIFIDGDMRDGVEVDGQTLTLDFSKIHPVDALAVLRDLYVAIDEEYPGRPRIKTIIKHVNEAIFEADRMAVESGGYSHSPEERNVALPYGN